MNQKPIAIGADAFALDLKEHVAAYLNTLGFRIEDYGVRPGEQTAYPDVASRVASALTSGFSNNGILLCATGIGMAITANKFPGIRAAVCHDLYSAERSRLSNNCQILCLGAKIISPEFAETILNVWMFTEFKNGRSTPKLQRLAQIESQLSISRYDPSAAAAD